MNDGIYYIIIGTLILLILAFAGCSTQEPCNCPVAKTQTRYIYLADPKYCKHPKGLFENEKK